jgi:hypothetical protein
VPDDATGRPEDTHVARDPATSEPVCRRN